MKSLIFFIVLFTAVCTLFFFQTVKAGSIPHTVSIVYFVDGKPVNFVCSINTEQMVILCAGEKIENKKK